MTRVDWFYIWLIRTLEYFKVPKFFSKFFSRVQNLKIWPLKILKFDLDSLLILVCPDLFWWRHVYYVIWRNFASYSSRVRFFSLILFLVMSHLTVIWIDWSKNRSDPIGRCAYVCIRPSPTPQHEKMDRPIRVDYYLPHSQKIIKILKK